MELTKTQINAYHHDGYLLLPEIFTPEEVDRLIQEAAPLKIKDSADVIWEDDDTNVRALMGCHFKSKFYRNLVQQARMLVPAKQLLGSDAYVYQFKINLKAPFKGEIWPWHQDFIYWHELDGMPAAHSVNITLFLDDCTEFNGPLWVIPGSHKKGIIAVTKTNREDGNWTRDVSANLSFKLDAPTVAGLVEQSGIKSIQGKAGSVLIFHPNIVHASLPNISPFQRRILIVTYNSTENIPIRRAQPRPEFLVSSQTSAEIMTNIPLLSQHQ